MKKKLVLVVALGMSFAPVLFAGETLGQLKSSQTSSAALRCGETSEKSLPSVSIESIRSSGAVSGAHIIK